MSAHGFPVVAGAVRRAFERALAVAGRGVDAREEERSLIGLVVYRA